MLLFITLASILLLLVLITVFKVHPFIALLVTALAVGLETNMPLTKIVTAIKDGLGGTLGFLAIVLALGTMLGKILAESGGAERIARTLIERFGKTHVHWAMTAVGFLVGIPMFFQVGFVLLIPLVFTIARETGISLVRIALPLVSSLSIVHGLVPPHPASIAAIGILKADVGLTILYALIVATPAAIVAGPLYGKWIGTKIFKTVPPHLASQLAPKREDHELPGFGNTLFTILLPVILMLLASWADITYPKEDPLRQVLDFIGDPIMSLLIATLYSFWSLGFARGMNKDQILKMTNDCLAPTAGILLVIGAGGSFSKVLVESGVGEYIGKIGADANVSPILLAWLIAALIRAATGTVTVATVTAAGIMAPIVAAMPGVSPELVVLAVGAGALSFSHVNDSAFWMMKEYFGMSVQETLKSWTVMELLASLTALAATLLLSFAV